MARMKLSRWLAVSTLAIALISSVASDLEADTLSINGTFHMDQLSGTVGADLADVFAHDNEHTWSLKLYDITLSHDEYYLEWNDEGGYGYIEEFYTFAHATSIDFQFFGPDAIVLNEVVSQQLIGGEAVLSLVNENSFDSLDFFGGGRKASWSLGLRPLDLAGVTFRAESWSLFHPFLPNSLLTDENGYPVVAPQRLYGDTYISDDRSGNSANLESYYDYVEIDLFTQILPGDYSGNGTVGPEDYDRWKASYGSTMNLAADGNNDHIVNAADYTVWRNNLRASLGAGSGVAGYPLGASATPLSPAVPEPATLTLVALCALNSTGFRRVPRLTEA